MKDLLGLLVEEGRIVEVGDGLHLDADVAASIRSTVHAHLLAYATATMAEIRDLLGTTRKYAVPIGEYLDRVGLTTRDGDLRRAGPASEAAP